MQSNKKRPEVWKYRDDTVKGAGYIWKLADIPRFYRTKEDLHLSNNALGQISSDAAATHRTAWASMATLGGQMEPGHAESTVASSRSSGELNTHESRPTPQPATALCSNDGTRPLISDQATSEAAPDLQEIHQRSPHEAHPARTPGSNHDQPLSAAIDGETEVITTIEESQKPTKDCNAEVIMQSEDRLHYGKLVLQLRQWKERRSQLTEEIAGAQILLGDIDVLQDHVVQASEELLELERQVEQAQNRVESARKDLEAAKNRAEYVTAAKREVERIDKTSLEVREQLGID
ncbi:hypothetical protein BAUCODRAFT_121738 [Baudoinia panamericana UAMH 10762]|uniref:Uncharacterized protein n=1 Tax=Baudoinia panamericana (strain UAMH 10762) TaxID=717646 RepID=M2MKM2_BAUPA|nr:uncharacterized protein BAUCODRAFT_121738 [Baudoinia panamericana UAMH 10762]EMC97241.1 hypothetical protein BAUCODRAFT_121738 [Baudoinia panamericana UAMH 10762]